MNRENLTLSFEQCRPQLKSYILRMTASVEDAEDIVQDTFIKAFSNITSFKGDSSIWSNTICTSDGQKWSKSLKISAL